MFGKKTADKVLEYINRLSDEEKSKLMQQLGIEEETAASDDTGETPEEVAEDAADQDAPENEDSAPEEDAPAEEDAAEDAPADEDQAEDAPEASAEDVAEDAETPASEETPEEAGNTAPENNDSAEALAALARRFDEMQATYEKRIADLEAFVEALKGQNTEQLDALGYQRAEQARKAGAEDYLTLRKRTIGV